MPWVVELLGRDLPNASGVDETKRFALGEGIAFTDAPYAEGGLISWASPTQRIEITPGGQTQTAADAGEIVLANVPRDLDSAGPWDALLDWAWKGRVALLYYLPGNVWAGKTLSARGLLEQPVADGYTLRFPLRDPRAELDAPLQTVKYAGDNVLPAGVEGTGDLKGKPKPIVVGTVSNFPGVLVNTSKLIYQLHDGAASVLCVRDGAAPLSAGVSRANVASLQANAPAPGKYDYTSGSGGTYIRLGSTPVFQMAFDVQVGATEADRTHAQVWKRLRTERCGTTPGDIVAASVTTVDTAAPKEVGFAWTEETTRRAALDHVLASLSGYEVQDLAGGWSIGQLLAPSGTPALDLVMVTPATAMTSTSRPLTTPPERARPSYAPDGAPPYRVNVHWGRNHTVMQAADFAGVASQRLRDKFATEWRTETATDTAIWNPVAATGAFPGAPELTLDTGYQPGADTLTSPHAATEAARLLALYGALPVKGWFQVGFTPEPGDALLAGQVISLTHPRYGLGSGPKFVCLQASWRVDREEPQAGMILGLQT